MARRWTVRLLACLATAPLLLAGCSSSKGSSAAAPPPKPSPATTTPALPPLGPPDLPMPEAARHHDAAGAEAFLRYYVALYNQAKDKLAPGYLREFSSDCSKCAQLVNQIETVARWGARFDGGDLHVEAVSAPLLMSGAAEIAVVLLSDSLVVLKDDAPLQGQTYSAGRDASSGAIVAWDPSRQAWLMKQLNIQ